MRINITEWGRFSLRVVYQEWFGSRGAYNLKNRRELEQRMEKMIPPGERDHKDLKPGSHQMTVDL